MTKFPSDEEINVILSQLAVQYGGSIVIERSLIQDLHSRGWRADVKIGANEDGKEVVVITGYCEQLST